MTVTQRKITEDDKWRARWGLLQGHFKAGSLRTPLPFWPGPTLSRSNEDRMAQGPDGYCNWTLA